jgi:hypothetical protein
MFETFAAVMMLIVFLVPDYTCLVGSAARMGKIRLGIVSSEHLHLFAMVSASLSSMDRAMV